MQENQSKANRVTLWAFICNILLTVLKMIAGFLANSEALIADAFHSLSDFSTDIAALWGYHASLRPQDKSHSYGHGKIETLISMMIGWVLLFVGFGILGKGGSLIYKVIQGYTIMRPGWLAFTVAIISILIKEWLYRYTKRVAQEIESSVILVNAWHHRSDAFSSIGVLIGIGGAILLGENWTILDPIAAVIVSFFIIQISVSIIYKNANELIEASLGNEISNEILAVVKNVNGVRYPHNLRTRRVGNKIVIDVHIKVDRSLNIVHAHDITSEVELALREKFGEDTIISVHAEPLNEGI